MTTQTNQYASKQEMKGGMNKMKNIKKMLRVGGVCLATLLSTWKVGDLATQAYDHMTGKDREPEFSLHVTRMPEKYGGKFVIRLDSKYCTIYDSDNGGWQANDYRVKVVSESFDDFVKSGIDMYGHSITNNNFHRYE